MGGFQERKCVGFYQQGEGQTNQQKKSGAFIGTADMMDFPYGFNHGFSTMQEFFITRIHGLAWMQTELGSSAISPTISLTRNHRSVYNHHYLVR